MPSTGSPPSERASRSQEEAGAAGVGASGSAGADARQPHSGPHWHCGPQHSTRPPEACGRSMQPPPHAAAGSDSMRLRSRAIA